MNKIQEAIDNLEDVLRAHCDKNVVSFSLFINCEGREITINERRLEQLEASHISMRNLAGDFIK